MTEQRTTRSRDARTGVAEDQATYRARAQAGARMRGLTATEELRKLVQRRATALVELAKR